MIDLKAKPFYLSDDDVNWVQSTLAGMTDDEKVAQLFCLITYSSDPGYLTHLARDVRPGGLMCRVMPAAEVVETVRVLQDNARIPMLIAANFEKGGDGIALEGTSIGSPLQVAATDDDMHAYRLGVVCGREGRAVGANWAFAPIVDIDLNFRNPITNTRTFGADADRVRRMGVEYVRGVQEQGMAAAVKHFPGDGVDERDQHLVTSINDLTCEDWDATFGAVYKACIDAGALSVMAGHIMQPAYSRKLKPGIADADILPASLAPELITGLLREQLGFNGLVITDATAMAGMAIPMPRAQAVPQAIAAGCDMFLFTRNLEEDFAYMKQGIAAGVITPERLNDALTRILALKAALKLHHQQADGTLAPSLSVALDVPGKADHRQWAAECADAGITLVKDNQHLLPITPERHRRVLFYDLQTGGEGFFNHSSETATHEVFIRLLEREGFEITRFDPSKGMEGLMQPSTAITGRYDLILYLAKLATKSNQTVVRIEWSMPMGANVPIYMASVPTLFISVENPYHLLDVPRVPAYINTYHSSETTLTALVDKLVGRSPFKGISPVDAFCGRWDTHL
jgi:beta-N-acetylhexosaminidase